jgi:phage terminase large subunit-like protein
MVGSAEDAVRAEAVTLAEIILLIPGYDPHRDAGDCVFDEAAAQMALDFFPECLTHTKGKWAGRPLVLEPWQQAIIANLFGWKRPDGTRRYREALIYLPRKNGKTQICAGIATFVLFCDGEPGAEIYSAAADEDQAKIAFNMAKQMVLQEPQLAARAKIVGKSIVYEALVSSYKPISSIADTKHGASTSLALIDELHVHKDRELLDVLITSTGARTQPLIVELTTADYQRPGSICNEKHEYASKVRDGVIDDPSFLPVIYEATREDDWTAEATWRKANPNLGISIGLDYMARECKRAQETPGYENTFKRLHLNIITEQASRWLALDRWDACRPQRTLEELEGEPCLAALDLAATTDIAALLLLFHDEATGDFDAHAFFWIPGDSAIAREKRDRVPYPVWIKQGLIRQTEGDVTDYDVIRRDINELRERFNVRECAIDRWSAAQITTQLQGDGLDVVPFGQGYASMSPAAKELEKHVLAGQIRHGGNPVLRWMASNVAIETDAAGNIKPSKKKSTERIDGIVALTMALGRAVVAKGEERSVYEDRGIDAV